MVILVMNTQFFHLLDTHSLMLTRTMMETASLSMLRWRLQREYPIPCRMVALMCNLEYFKKCTCLSPATYTKDGRGNCNVGASKMDLRVWCYVDPKAARMCPDALASKSK